MIYNDFHGLALPLLGLGSATIPLAQGISAQEAQKAKTFDIFNKEKIEQILNLYLNAGSNYIELANGYHNGLSQQFLSQLLKTRPRESLLIANKAGQTSFSNFKEQVFYQLKLCNLQYFDFFLLHGLSPHNMEIYQTYIEDLLYLKEKGYIKYIGFSEHTDLQTFYIWLTRNSSVFDFAQIQLNWIDWTFLEIETKVCLLQEYNLPIWVMCPLKNQMGTRILTQKISLQEKEHLNSFEVLSPNEWTFRFLQTIPEVKMVLTGPTELSHCQENLKIFNKRNPLVPEAFEYLISLGQKYTEELSYSCINCGYCLKNCPQQIDIPGVLLNDLKDFSLYKERPIKEFFSSSFRLKKALTCIDCKQCEKSCTQFVPITDIFKILKKYN